MIILWVVVYQIEQNDHRRDQRACALYLCYAHPSVRLGLRLLWALCVLPCSVTKAEFFFLKKINFYIFFSATTGNLLAGYLAQPRPPGR
jgi:hypothetical protein